MLEEWGSSSSKRSSTTTSVGPRSSASPSMTAAGKASSWTSRSEDARGRQPRCSTPVRWPRLFFGHDGQGRPQLKRYLENVEDRGRYRRRTGPRTTRTSRSASDAVSWEHEESGHSQSGIDELTRSLAGAWVADGQAAASCSARSSRSGARRRARAGSVRGVGDDGPRGPAAQRAADRPPLHLIEQGRPERATPYARSLTADRLKRVISGDWANGEG